MTKAEFVDKLAAKSGLTKKDAAAVVDAFVEVVTEALKKGEDVQFTGFGKFYVQDVRLGRGSTRRPRPRSRSRPLRSRSSARVSLSRALSSDCGRQTEHQGRLARPFFSSGSAR